MDTLADLEADLAAFARVWATQMAEHSDDFALVRQIHAELGYVPLPAIEAWQNAGPRRVHYEFARRVAELGERGLLHVGDSTLAVGHLALATAEILNRSIMETMERKNPRTRRSPGGGFSRALCIRRT